MVASILTALALCEALPPAFQEKLEPGNAIVVTPTQEDGLILRTPVMVILPANTPYPRGSADEQHYLRGYSLGYLDCVNGRLM